MSAGYRDALEEVATATGGRVIGSREVELPAGYGRELEGAPEVCEPCGGCAGCDECAPGETLEPAPVPAPGGWQHAAPDSDGYVRVGGDGPIYLVADDHERAAVDRRELAAAPGRVVVPAADRIPWCKWHYYLEDDERDAYRVRRVPGASPRLAAYIGRLSDGPTADFAWWVAWVECTGAPDRFGAPDIDRYDEWISRKSPAQIRAKVRRLRFDRRPYVGADRTVDG